MNGVLTSRIDFLEFLNSLIYVFFLSNQRGHVVYLGDVRDHLNHLLYPRLICRVTERVVNNNCLSEYF